MKTKKRTVEYYAKLIGIPAQTLRCMLQTGKCPFGIAWKNEGSTHYQYMIYDGVFRQHFGLPAEEAPA